VPVAERSPLAVRGRKTICVPCSPEEYERAVDYPERFRNSWTSTSRLRFDHGMLKKENSEHDKPPGPVECV